MPRRPSPLPTDPAPPPAPALPIRLIAPDELSPELPSSQLPAPEHELLALRRAVCSIFLTAFWRLTFLTLLFIAAVALIITALAPALGVRLGVLCLVATLVILTWESIKRDAHRYSLTDQRLLWRLGILRRVIVDIPLSRIQNIVLSQSFLERLFSVGTIRVSSAADAGPPIILRHIPRPHDTYHALRDAAARYPAASRPARTTLMPIPYPTPAPDNARFMPVIGIVGGIGAGKSTVALAFQRLGCYVIDSDTRAKEALDRPDVRDQLTQWWGSAILSPSGRVDRAKVAAIIFQDPAQRARLEALVHPIVRQDRARMIEEASRFWAKGVIVDAPLLFEAGVDKECDAVVFVDAPRELRLQRVRQTRAWTEAEFTRRESSQLPLEEKRARSHYTISNTPGDNLDTQAAQILARLRAAVG